MNQEKTLTNDVVNYLQQVKVAQARTLAELFNCSKRTIFRRLNVHGYLTSYNMNGCVLTLPETPVFNDKGLWIYERAGFSTWKTLIKTIQHVIEGSDAGLTAGECKSILQANVYNHLTTITKSGIIFCDKRSWGSVYYSIDKQIREQQSKNREIKEKERLPKKLRVSKDEIIRILVVALKHHETSIEKLMPQLVLENIQVDKKVVEWIFYKYQIKKKASH